jgi:hypothetical protein
MKCPYCGVPGIRKGIRRGCIKYLCKKCGRWYQVRRTRKNPYGSLLLPHIYGMSFRSLASQYGINPSTAYRRCLKVLENLPHCADVTRQYCARFCGILLVDGKYISVKGYERKIPVIYGIDYLTHDIPSYIFSISENYQTCISFFRSLRLLNYPLSAIVCDDNINIYQACTNIYPSSIIQLCHNHYKQSLRLGLSVRTDSSYLPFMRDIEQLFEKRISMEEFTRLAGKITLKYASDPRCVTIMADIQRRLPLLTGYMAAKRIPRTTNLIESFNSHLEGRLKTIKGFQSFKHADAWLNAYFLNRRLKPFTDCEKRFRYLNGKRSLELSKKPYYPIDDLLRLIR